MDFILKRWPEILAQIDSQNLYLPPQIPNNSISAPTPQLSSIPQSVPTPQTNSQNIHSAVEDVFCRRGILRPFRFLLQLWRLDGL